MSERCVHQKFTSLVSVLVIGAALHGSACGGASETGVESGDSNSKKENEESSGDEETDKLTMKPPGDEEVSSSESSSEGTSDSGTSGPETTETGETGTETTGPETTGTQETGETGTGETGPETTGSEATGPEDTGETETETTGTEDTSTEDTSTEDTSTEDTSTEDTSTEDTSTEDSGSEDGDETCDLLMQDCPDGQACYPSADVAGGTCDTPFPSPGPSGCDRDNRNCELGWYCSRDHFGSCEQLCDLSLAGDGCTPPTNLPNQNMNCRDPSIHPMPDNVGYCSLF